MQTFKKLQNTLFVLFLICLATSISFRSYAQWTNASSGLPTSGPPLSTFTAMAESGTTMYIGSLNGDLFYNDFSTGLSKSWTAITRPSGALKPITNICAVGSYLYVNWNNEIYLSSNNGASWTLVASNLDAPVPSSNYYQNFKNQLFASDGTFFWYVKESTGTIYQSTLGTTSGTWTTFNTLTGVGTINCFYQYQNRLLLGTSTGLYATKATAASGGWSTEFAGTPFSGTAVYQFVNTQYSTTYPDPVPNNGGGILANLTCSPPPTTVYTYYPFYMITNACGNTPSTACPKIIQQVETRSAVLTSSGPGGGIFCPGGTLYKWNWQSSFSYNDNGSRSFGFPSNSSYNNFVTASGNVTAPTASATKIWGVTTASSGSELGSYVNTSTWSTGTGSITGLPTITSSLQLNAALGSHITYGSTSGLVFLSCYYPASYTRIYAMSYTAAKTGDDEGPIFKLDAKELSSSLNIFPNPATNKITFDISTLSSSDFDLKLYNQLGQEVLIPASNSTLDAGEMKLSVNVSTLPTGVYFYKLNADKNYSGKFVKE